MSGPSQNFYRYFNIFFSTLSSISDILCYSLSFSFLYFLNFNFFAEFFPVDSLLIHCITSHFFMLLTFSNSWIEFICLFVSLRPLVIIIINLNSVLLASLPLNLVVKKWHLERNHFVFLFNVSILWHESFMVWILLLLFLDFCTEKAFVESFFSSTTKIEEKNTNNNRTNKIPL